MFIKSQISLLVTEFYQGKYKAVIDQIGRAPIARKIVDFEELTSLQIGTLVFIGELQEAQILFDRALREAEELTGGNLLFKVRCRFYLGIGAVRRSKYAEAASYFAQNILEIKSLKKNKTTEMAEILFYAYQGSAFFRFFKGQFKKTQALTERSYRAAFDGQFNYGQILALDLLGHSLCLLGSIRRGLFELERALSLAIELGNGGVATALKISMIKYRAQFGLDMRRSTQNLIAAINSLDPQDTYSKAELYLELIRQLILRGKGREAQKQLEQAGNIIYRHQNKRQTAIFNLRCAHLLLLRGETHAAMALTSTLRLNLNPKIDLVILHMVDELERKIRFKLDGHYSPKSDEYRAINFIDNRLQNYNFFGEKKVISTNLGENPLGGILDNSNNSNLQMFYEVKKLGLFGIMPKLLGLPIGVTGIFLGPSRSEIIVVSGCDVMSIDRGVTGPIKKLISLLVGADFKSKEFLINKIWGYSYDPGIHDRLLHATIGKLRNLLGEFSYWVEWSNEGYRLASQIEVFTDDDNQNRVEKNDEGVLEPETKNILTPNSESYPKKPVQNLDLNIRQIKVLNWLKTGEYIGVTEYAKRYKICKMTACRDLTSLHRASHVIKLGRARATAYGLSEH